MSIQIGNVLSLFDGISCGQIALNRVGVEYGSYYASEIDRHAIKVTQHNYPNTIQLGDVTKVNGFDLPEIGLLMGGSPCQGFSFAGKGLNFEDPRSKLFFEYVRLLKETKPKYFLLENVRMKRECQDVITKELGVEPVIINSASLSAQNRHRLFWTNIPVESLKDSSSKMLVDILEKDPSPNLLLSESYTLKMKTNPSETRLSVLSRNYRFNHRVTQFEPVLVSEVNKDTPSGRSRQTDRLYSSLSKSPTLLANRACDMKIDCGTSDSTKWRTLTPVEAERLQTVPDGYTSVISDLKRFHALGNGWTVDVIAHIFKGLS